MWNYLKNIGAFMIFFSPYDGDHISAAEFFLALHLKKFPS